MKSVLDTYLGWQTPQHLKDCRKPVWDIGIRTEEREYRRHHYGEPAPKHKCADEYCTHGNSFDKTVVRIVCWSCGEARVIDGEKTEDTGESATAARWLGYGLQPRQMVSLLLWPAEPSLDLGRAVSDEPHDFVVTRTRVKQVTAETVVGQITQSLGSKGGLVWTALAVPGEGGQYGFGQPVRFAQRNDGRGQGGGPLRSLGAAARWIAARLAEQQTTGGAA